MKIITITSEKSWDKAITVTVSLAVQTFDHKNYAVLTENGEVKATESPADNELVVLEPGVVDICTTETIYWIHAYIKLMKLHEYFACDRTAENMDKPLILTVIAKAA